MLNPVEPFSPDIYWIVILAFIIAFLLAFSVGANDVSNSFGTSVGSKVLTVTQACIFATIFETAGATLLGHEVCDTFRKKMYDQDLYIGSEKELLLGFFSCLIGSSLWNILATMFKMPISGTHSVVGATIGFAVVSRGFSSIKWMAMLRIVASWFASPLLSGLVSAIIYMIISKTIISHSDALEPGLKALPLFYGATIFINVASVVIGGPKSLHLDDLPWYYGLLISFLVAIVVICLIAFFFVPQLRKNITKEVILKSEMFKPLPFKKPARKPVITSAFDNASFEPDPSLGGLKPIGEFVAIDTDRKKIMTSKPKEMDLGTISPIDSIDQSQKPILREKPIIAPKPARLRTTTFIESTPEQVTKVHIDQRLSTTSTSTSSSSSTTNRSASICTIASSVSKKLANDALSTKSTSLNQELRDNTFDKVSRDMQILGSRDCLVVDLDTPELRLPSLPYGKSPSSGDLKQNDDGQLIQQGEKYEIYRLFASLQIMTACFASFAHGTNDVSNAVAPLIPIWFIFINGKEDLTVETPIWLLLLGGIGICTGLWAWGRSVMTTIGSGLTQLTPTKGFAVELGAATAVLGATKLGLPISTTHCKVGSVVIVGLVASKFCQQDRRTNTKFTTTSDNKTTILPGQDQTKMEQEKRSGSIDWSLFRNIVLAWIITVPFAATASALTMYILSYLLL